jgi:predicted hydrocarbon binding protein
MTDLKYRFSWDLLGNIELGRPNLGPTTRLEIYRLMQFTLRDILEKEFGTEKADGLFREAGYLAGMEFYRHMLGEATEFGDFTKKLQEVLKEMQIGVLRIEKADLTEGTIILTISEDLDCSGLPEMDYEICVYDEGFIAALLESFSGHKFEVQEVDCWCTGDRTCRFTATMLRE